LRSCRRSTSQTVRPSPQHVRHGRTCHSAPQLNGSNSALVSRCTPLDMLTYVLLDVLAHVKARGSVGHLPGVFINIDCERHSYLHVTQPLSLPPCGCSP